jgi:hypothetical protein
VIYSYHKMETAAPDLLEMLIPTVLGNIHLLKPRELTSILMAYSEQGFFDGTQGSEDSSSKDLVVLKNPELLAAFEKQFHARHEQMNPEDISKYYYCFTKANFSGNGRFYKYLQRALTKTIKQFDSGNLRYMFVNFDKEERSRLNRGIRGRLQDRLKALMDQKKMKGFDVQYIYEHTRDLKHSDDPTDTRKHEIHFLCRIYLEKIKYFS